ncbi:hypothetical protein SAMN04515666_103619 [Bosea lupini]|uniref:Uncharacterized protein n=1 Tax=Bosea lupini TaxID=1036779 RepID=A0A1H7PUW0_9HYPH|nr:hypothetical protein [Bosea lupini]SEL39630.1 hypothetical protein SAMN04515666_103619 [Bosea lupini]
MKDLFDWADRNERNAARREARRRKRLKQQDVPAKPAPAMLHPGPSAQIVNFEDERWRRYRRLLQSERAAYYREQSRAAGALPPAPILPFDQLRRA